MRTLLKRSNNSPMWALPSSAVMKADQDARTSPWDKERTTTKLRATAKHRSSVGSALLKSTTLFNKFYACLRDYRDIVRTRKTNVATISITYIIRNSLLHFEAKPQICEVRSFSLIELQTRYISFR